MDSLLERIEENRLDALYLFITDVLRTDAPTFRRFFENLIAVLPQNYSVHRIEAGHEFLKQMSSDGGPAQVEEDQRRLFRTVTELESLRTLIVSDGYVQRTDTGALNTRIFLQELPRATSLVNLDIHRMALQSAQDIELLALACESVSESLEDLRLTGLFLDERGYDYHAQPMTLDPVVEVLLDFEHLRSLTLALAGPTGDDEDGASPPQGDSKVSPHLWCELCQLTTLQDLTVRHMRLDDAALTQMSRALQETSFLTSLDLRQNPRITQAGYTAISRALELNFSSWCSVAVDDAQYQSVYHVLIELNQHNRGDVVRNLSRHNFCAFLNALESPNVNPTAIYYFLRIHDSVRTPLASYLIFQTLQERRRRQQQNRKRKAEDLEQDVEYSGVLLLNENRTVHE